ncbi:MAG TPA: helix-turn-helix domain-containing protein [Actinocrinis sp.]|nr:helix-turn-helix domain-containing protein [Actinocrinis sp.]
MGNREDLLAGAKRCLFEKGYARTTARDIAAASGVSLAAIGYHFGSKDALMNQAVYDSIGDWADEVERALSAAGDLAAPPLRRFESVMERTIASFAGEAHGLWASQLELMTLINQNDELRTFLAGVQKDAAEGLAELFLGINPQQDPESARAAGSVYHAMFIGILVKWFMDPKQALTAHELANGLRIIADRVAANQPAPASAPADVGNA